MGLFAQDLSSCPLSTRCGHWPLCCFPPVANLAVAATFAGQFLVDHLALPWMRFGPQGSPDAPGHIFDPPGAGGGSRTLAKPANLLKLVRSRAIGFTL